MAERCKPATKVRFIQPFREMYELCKAFTMRVECERTERGI